MLCVTGNFGAIKFIELLWTAYGSSSSSSSIFQTSCNECSYNRISKY